ncbi:MAG: leucine-rich repeat protein [Bacilli bacterium]|nr:leucine-rich repeat protein [Bacilli bacterium]
MKHKIFKTFVPMLFPLLLVGCGNNQPEPEPEQPKNELTITCTKGPMTLNLIAHARAKTGKVIDYNINLRHSKDKINWENQTFQIQTSEEINKIIWSIELKKGESVYLAGNNPDGFSFINEETGAVTLSFSDTTLNSSANENDVEFKVSGSPLSLINATDFDIIELPPSSIATFQSLFLNSSVVDASELILSSQTLTTLCYANMFFECEKLINAPELPATTLTIGCYDGMFDNCTNLVNAPILPATTLAIGCYERMFDNCGSLTNAPTLPATTLAAGCYNHMFYRCTNLVNAPILPATTFNKQCEGCYSGMFEDCGKLANVEVSFGEGNNWPKIDSVGDFTYDWLVSAGWSVENPIFKWKGSSENLALERSGSTVPTNWKIEHID